MVIPNDFVSNTYADPLILNFGTLAGNIAIKVTYLLIFAYNISSTLVSFQNMLLPSGPLNKIWAGTLLLNFSESDENCCFQLDKLILKLGSIKLIIHKLLSVPAATKSSPNLDQTSSTMLKLVDTAKTGVLEWFVIYSALINLLGRPCLLLAPEADLFIHYWQHFTADTHGSVGPVCGV